MCYSFIKSKYAQQIVDKLRKMIDANMPIIYIDSCDYARIDAIICEVRIDKSDDGTAITIWDPTEDITTDGGKEKNLHNRLATFLQEKYNGNIDAPDGKQCFIVLKGINDLIDYPTVKMLLIKLAQLHIYQSDLKDECDNYFRDNTTIFIVSSVVNVPKELEMYVSYLNIPYPDEEEISRLIEEHREINDAPEIEENIKGKLIESLRGLTEYEIDSILDMAISVNGKIDAQDNNLIKEQKRERVRRSMILDYIDLDKINEYDVGGLEKLQKYIADQGYIIKNIEDAKKFGVPVPKGIFLWGKPGCGKSLSAKVVAKKMNIPLLKLDMGSLLGSLQGQAEARMREALHIADATAPCILWIDEIEKGFSGVNGVGGSSDTVTHMFGYFLTWLQEKKSSVYVIATANHPEYMPKEILRKGRFDQMFYLDSPKEEGRMQIFGINLYKFFKKNNYNIAEIYQNSDQPGERKRIEFKHAENNPCNLKYYYNFYKEYKKKCEEAHYKDECEESDIIKCSMNWSGAEIEAAVFSVIQQCYMECKKDFEDKNLEKGIGIFLERLAKTVQEEGKKSSANKEKEQMSEEEEWLRQHSIDSSTGETPEYVKCH